MRMPCTPVLVLLIGSAATAGALDPGVVDPQSNWLVHVDVEAVMRSRIVALAMQHEGVFDGEWELDFGEDELAGLAGGLPGDPRELKERWGFDIFSDVLDITIFGTDDEDPDAVIIRTTAAIDRVVAEMNKIENVDVAQHNGAMILKLQEDDDGDDAFYASVQPIAGDLRQIVLSETLDGLAHSVSTIDDRLHRRDPGPSWARFTPGSMIGVHTGSPGALVDLDDSPILKNARGAHVEIEETVDNLDLRIRLETDSAEAAQTMLQVAQGLVALGQLTIAGEPEAKEFAPLLRGLSLGTDDKAVTLHLAVPIDIVTQLINADCDDETDEVEVLDDEHEVRISIDQDVRIRLGLNTSEQLPELE